MSDSRPQLLAQAELLEKELIAAADNPRKLQLLMISRLARIEAKVDYAALATEMQSRQLAAHIGEDERAQTELKQQITAVGTQINIAVQATDALENRNQKTDAEETGKKQVWKKIAVVLGWLSTTGLAIWATLKSK